MNGEIEAPMLCYGLGRSYGDVCLNENGTLIDTSHLSRFMSFDEQSGILRCESGVTFAEILSVFASRGWFPPVTPGTKFVTIGGAIANDVHGKNHHSAGTFGCYVLKFALLRSDGQEVICSPDENSELYHATIAGVGLTGMILWADIQLKHIENEYIDMESIRFRNLDKFFNLSSESDREYEYTVAWVDTGAKGTDLGRGIFMRGNHHPSANIRSNSTKNMPVINLPIEAPEIFLNGLTAKLFNMIYYHKQQKEIVKKTVHYHPFFYPLDSIGNWNRMYGKRGFFQYQCVVPLKDGGEAIGEILERVSTSGQASFLTVLKVFGDKKSPGLLSFPRPGVTLTMDFANRGDMTFRLFDDLDRIVKSAAGALYPCKDARMPPEMFKASFPNWKDFLQYKDPNFSSSFWRRVMGEG